MRILHFNVTMTGGGISSMVTGLSNAMSKKEDVDVCVIYEIKDSDAFAGKFDSSVKVHSLGKKSVGFSLRYIWKVFKFIKDNNYDVVNLHGFFYFYCLPIFLLHNKVKFFYTVHSDAKKECSRWDRYLLPLKRFCFRMGWMRAITISDESKRSFTELYNCDSTLIYNGVPKPEIRQSTNELSKYKFNSKTKLFIHAGRISYAKNQEVLCRVFNTLINEGYDIALVIVGGNQDESIMSRLRSFFSDRIVYLGEVTNVPDLMSQCIGLCMPSIFEGLPCAVLEAFSVGCIPICSPVGGIPNVIEDGVNGFLSKSSSYNDYCHAMRQFLSLSEAEISEIRNNSITSFDKYDITSVASKYVDAYKSV